MVAAQLEAGQCIQPTGPHARILRCSWLIGANIRLTPRHVPSAESGPTPSRPLAALVFAPLAAAVLHVESGRIHSRHLAALVFAPLAAAVRLAEVGRTLSRPLAARFLAPLAAVRLAQSGSTLSLLSQHCFPPFTKLQSSEFLLPSVLFAW